MHRPMNIYPSILCWFCLSIYQVCHSMLNTVIQSTAQRQLEMPLLTPVIVSYVHAGYFLTIIFSYNYFYNYFFPEMFRPGNYYFG